LKTKAIVTTAAALGMALFFCAQGARAATPASDQGSLYQNPWGPANPQNRTTSGFAPWVFDVFDPSDNPVPNPFFIDTARGAWGIHMLADSPSELGYNAAWTSFKGDKHLNPGQTFSTTVLFTPPAAPNSTKELPTEGVDFFAQDPSVPSHYDNFGHQVLGVYLGTYSTGTRFIRFTLLVHTGNAPSDENPSVIQTIPVAFTGTATIPQVVEITYTQQAQGHWTLRFESEASSLGGGKTVILTSHEYGATWNTTAAEGVDAVRYFTSQGGSSPGGPLEWQNRSVLPGVQ